MLDVNRSPLPLPSPPSQIAQMIRVYLEKTASAESVESGELAMLTQALASSSIDTEIDQV